MSKYIIREKHLNNFVIISNETLRNDKLSWEARGMLAWMLTMSDDWIFTIDFITKQSPCGKKKTRNILNELVSAGHVKRIGATYQNDRLIKCIYVIYEKSQNKFENFPKGHT